MKDAFWLRKLRQLGKKFGYRLIDGESPEALFSELMKFRDGGESTAKSRKHEFLAYVLRNINLSKAQLCQDLFALFMTGDKREGYFVEFGATNGILLSNTYLLETAYGWNGILAEPAKSWHEALHKNRRCAIDERCVWKRSGEQLEFNEVHEGELSTIAEFSESDGHEQSRKNGMRYMVETITLNELLRSHGAPGVIDYMSVDTEGSELEILSHFDFSQHDIRIISVEHNFTPERERLYALLKSKGYARVFEKFSQWDDWYVKE
ncbi:MAG: FkbM family methyltransferase [Gammaproteobacteria bacterium]|nr:FkbM family methyltransferase [Gammaproteobacteria bacterium]MBU1624050.1 FkbM family methyltransferase [Gammaproteobacteria bacterium]MBU1981778.1 FkbM family methyltransferase [Gammaproteobacteria bacterium]